LKSFILIFILLSSSLYADAKIYLGLSYANVNEKFTDVEAESSSDALRIKLGYGEIDAYAIELSVDSMKNESNVFSNNDGDKYALNIELVKSFDLDTFIYPYFKAGFGAGYVDIERELQSRLNYGSFNFEVGTFLQINEHLDFELGYNYKTISYESINMLSEELKYESKSTTLYFGFNTRF
jgi:hypothetical protein